MGDVAASDEAGDLARPALQRHELLRLDPVAWSALLARDPTLAAIPLLADWAARGWPAMVRRPRPEDAAQVPAAIPLPRAFSPTRIAFSLPWAAVRDRRPPPRLAEVVLPAAWRMAQDRLLAAGRTVSVEPRVFGSLMWAHVTGLSYLAPTSDLDLVWPVADGEAATALGGAIARIEAATGVRIDGELIDPAGAAVQWREWATGVAEVMVKSMGGVAVRRRDQCFRTMAAAA